RAMLGSDPTSIARPGWRAGSSPRHAPGPPGCTTRPAPLVPRARRCLRGRHQEQERIDPEHHANLAQATAREKQPSRAGDDRDRAEHDAELKRGLGSLKATVARL